MADIGILDILKIMFSDPNVIKSLPPELLNTLNQVLFIVKAIGILVIIYIVFLIVTSFMNFIRNIRIKKIYKKVYEMDEKLNILIERSSKKEKDKNVGDKKKK